MFNTSTLPGSVAVPLSTELPELQGLNYTAKEGKDETPIYEELNDRLMQLETSTELHEEELNAIEESSVELVVSIDAKKEVQLRIDWLKRLYDVRKTLPSVFTVTEIERLRTMLSSVQTCPLKSELLTRLDCLTVSLSAETVPIIKSKFDLLMEIAIEQAGEDFINLGKAGRDSVIADVLKQSVKKQATIEAVQEHSKALEERVEALTAINESKELIEQLDILPLTSFHALPAERRGRIAEDLLENNKWIGLASLDRMIAHLDRAITNEEQQQEEAKNKILTLDGKAALTLDIKNLEDGRVQLS